MAEVKKEAQLKRNTVAISTTEGKLVVCSAQETVSWESGNAQIIGIGKDRLTALAAVDVQFENLKKILGVP